MAIRKEDLYQLIDYLDEHDHKTVHEFISFMIQKHNNPYYMIDQLKPEDIPLNEEEKEQLKCKEESYVTLEDVKNELNL